MLRCQAVISASALTRKRTDAWGCSSQNFLAHPHYFRPFSLVHLQCSERCFFTTLCNNSSILADTFFSFSKCDIYIDVFMGNTKDDIPISDMNVTKNMEKFFNSV